MRDECYHPPSSTLAHKLADLVPAAQPPLSQGHRPILQVRGVRLEIKFLLKFPRPCWLSAAGPLCGDASSFSGSDWGFKGSGSLSV